MIKGNFSFPVFLRASIFNFIECFLFFSFPIHTQRTMTDQRTSQGILEKIKALKSARVEAIQANKRAVYDEASGGKEKNREKQKVKDAFNDEAEQISEHDIEGKERTKRPKKTHGKCKGESQLALQNYKKLAERTYAKNVKEMDDHGLKKTRTEYLEEKELVKKLKAEGLGEEEIRSKLTSRTKLDKYVQKVTSWEKKVYEHRHKSNAIEGADGAIHEKNLHFNNKLKRHYNSIDQ